MEKLYLINVFQLTTEEAQHHKEEEALLPNGHQGTVAVDGLS